MAWRPPPGCRTTRLVRRVGLVKARSHRDGVSIMAARGRVQRGVFNKWLTRGKLIYSLGGDGRLRSPAKARPGGSVRSKRSFPSRRFLPPGSGLTHPAHASHPPGEPMTEASRSHDADCSPSRGATSSGPSARRPSPRRSPCIGARRPRPRPPRQGRPRRPSAAGRDGRRAVLQDAQGRTAEAHLLPVRPPAAVEGPQQLGDRQADDRAT